MKTLIKGIIKIKQKIQNLKQWEKNVRAATKIERWQPPSTTLPQKKDKGKKKKKRREEKKKNWGQQVIKNIINSNSMSFSK